MGTLVLNGATSGSTTIQPTDAATVTATLPGATGTIMVSGNMPAFSAYKSGGNQSISANTWTKCTFQTKEFDTNNNFDNATNYRFTPTVAGYYQIQGCVYITGGAYEAYYGISLYKNGSQYKSNAMNTANGQLGDVAMTVSSVVYCNGSTDYLEIYGYTNLTTSPVFTGSTIYTTWFNGVLVRTA